MDFSLFKLLEVEFDFEITRAQNLFDEARIRSKNLPTDKFAFASMAKDFAAVTKFLNDNQL